MTFIKRLLTSIVLFVLLFIVLYFAIAIVGGAVSGAIAGVQGANAQESFELGQRAGENFVKNNIVLIVLGSLGISLLSSLALSFSGVFPWCRKPSKQADAASL